MLDDAPGRKLIVGSDKNENNALMTKQKEVDGNEVYATQTEQAAGAGTSKGHPSDIRRHPLQSSQRSCLTVPQRRPSATTRCHFQKPQRRTKKLSRRDCPSRALLSALAHLTVTADPILRTGGGIIAANF